MRLSGYILLILLLPLGIGIKGQTTILQEGFEIDHGDFNVSPTGSWTRISEFQSEGTTSVHQKLVSQGDDISMRSSPNLPVNSHLPAVYLEFDHICKISPNELATLQYSINGGAPQPLTTVEYQGPAGNYTGDKFSAVSYSNWDDANPLTIDNSWWKHEKFLIPITTPGTIQIGFILKEISGGVPEDYYGWLIDNIKITDIGFDCNSLAFTENLNACVGSDIDVSGLVLPPDVVDGDVTWTLDDGTTSQVSNNLVPDFQFPVSGNYELNLEIDYGICYRFKENNNTTIVVHDPVPGQSITVTAGTSCGLFGFMTVLQGQNYTNPILSYGDGYFTTGTNGTHTYTANGTYVVSLTADDLYCPIITTVAVTAMPELNFTYNVTDECLASSGVDLTITNFDPSYSYFWEINPGTPSETIEVVTQATDHYTTGFLGGTNVVQLVALDANGCTAAVSSVFTIYDISAQFNLDESAACTGDFLQILGVMTGADSYTWTIDPLGGTAVTQSGQQPIYPFTSADTYTVSLVVSSTTSSGSTCTNTFPVLPATETVLVSDPIDAGFGYWLSTDTCGRVSLSLDGAQTTTNYTLDFGDGPSSVFNGIDITTMISNEEHRYLYTANGIYTITLTLDNGACTSTYTQVININNYATVGIIGSDYFCPGSSTELITSLSNLSGTGGVTYVWEMSIDGGTTWTSVGTYSNYIATEVADYKVTVTPAVGSTICFDATNNNSTHTLNGLEEPTGVATLVDKADCGVNNGTANMVITSALEIQNVLINGVPDAGLTTPVTGLSEGDNYITITHTLDATCTGNILVTVPSKAPILSLTPTPAGCSDTDGNLEITVNNILSDVTYNVYSSSNLSSPIATGAMTLPGALQNVNIALGPGSYSVEIIDVSGCTVSQVVAINSTTMSIAMANENLATCTVGIDATVNVSYNVAPQSQPNLDYIWEIDNAGTWNPYASTNGTSAVSDIQSVLPGFYRVTVQESGNTSCIQTLTFTVNELPAISGTLEVNEPQCPGDDATLNVIATGGDGNYTYLWSYQAQTTQNITITNVTGSANVDITISDNSGCTVYTNNPPVVISDVSSMSLTQIGTETVILANAPIAAYALSGCTLDLVASGGTSPYTFEWYLTGQESQEAEDVYFDLIGGQIYPEGNTTNPVNVPGSADVPADVLTERVDQGANPLPINFSVNDAVSNYAYWTYETDATITPNLQAPIPPATVATIPYVVHNFNTVIGEELIHEHTGTSAGTTTATENLVTGDYNIIMTDANGCTQPFGIVHIDEEQISSFVPFSIIWAKNPVVEEEIIVDENLKDELAEAANDMLNSLGECLQSSVSEEKQKYASACFNKSGFGDELGIEYIEKVHHYSLFYYDRAGNLTKTVPPEGVDLLSVIQIGEIELYREQGSAVTFPSKILPIHELYTTYDYNSLGQLINQFSFDGGESNFAYDGLSRLRFSQNKEQFVQGKYSYVKYDHLGRTIEAGEAELPTGVSFSNLSSTANSYINDFDNTDPYNSFPSSTEVKTNFTRTYYSEPTQVDYYGEGQRFLQNRISYVYNDEDGNPTTINDQHYTYYSYDPHGNVEWLIQRDPEIGMNYLAYEYDLISGNVLKVRYNEHRSDRFFHRYSYDSENRLSYAETSRDGELWDKDAQYDYYMHGPLKRTVTGEDKVQGTDNVFTISGWMKAINSPQLTYGNDPGADGGVITSGNDWSTSLVAQDRFGMVLEYYNDDYIRSTTSGFNEGGAALLASANTNGHGHDLYNGNIRQWSYSQLDVTNIQTVIDTRASQYNYDVLNRIKQSVSYQQSGAPGSLAWAPLANDAYKTNYTYDANGNLQSLTRKDAANAALMDNINYYYLAEDDLGNQEEWIDGGTVTPGYNKTNRLKRIDELDNVINGTQGSDIMGEHTYVYDKIGNLIQETGPEYLDLGSGHQHYDVTIDIIWNVSGKVQKIEKTIANPLNGSMIEQQEKLEFSYDALGNRVKKMHKTHFDAAVYNPNYQYLSSETTVNYYTLDASGNPMAMYEKTLNGTNIELWLKEHPIYGSKRIGLDRHEVLLASVDGTGNPPMIYLEPLGSGVVKRSEYQNWIISGNRTLLPGNNDELCECKINKLDRLGTQSPVDDLEYTEGSELVQFLGIAENGIAVAENLDGIAQFYVVLAKKYLGNSDACLVYDINGNLMKGTEMIGAIDASSKPVIVNLPGSSKYSIVTLGADQQPKYHVVDMNELGYSIIPGDNYGEIKEFNLPMTTSPVGTDYGWHYTGIEDHINQKSLVYTTRYTPSLMPGEGTTELVVFELTANTNLLPQEHVLYSIDGCGSTEMGELQISPEGNKLLWYQHDKNLAGFDYRIAEIYSIELNLDRISTNGTVDIVTLDAMGNIGGGNGEYMQNNEDYIYSQRGIYNDGGTGVNKNIWKYTKATPTIDPLNPSSIYLFSEIKRGVDGNYYMPNLDEPIQQIHTYKPAESSTTAQSFYNNADYLFNDANFGDASFRYSGSLPTQVYKLYDTGGESIEYIRYIGDKVYELTDHLGNVRVVISDEKVIEDGDGDLTNISVGDYYTPFVVSIADYYPFGMLMPGRHASSDTYRYGFQGQERDDEVKGAGNSVNYKYRMHDPRLGRFFAVDPLTSKYPELTPYQFSSNQPIHAAELEGLESSDPLGAEKEGPDGETHRVPNFDGSEDNSGRYQYNHSGQLKSFTMEWASQNGTLKFEWNEDLGDYYSETEGLGWFEFVSEFYVNAEASHWQYSILKMANAGGGFALQAANDPGGAWDELNDPKNIVNTADASYTDILTLAAGITWFKYRTRYAKTIYSSKITKNLTKNPKMIWGMSVEEIVNNFERAGYETIVEKSTKGSMKSTQIRIVGHSEITNIQVHPGGGRHVGAYYKISTSQVGVIRVVDAKTFAGEGMKGAVIDINK